MEETTSPVSFGDWLKCRRKELDLTQIELAQRAGCSVPALRKIETGERRPSKQLAGLLARALEIPIEVQADFIRVARGDPDIEQLRPLISARIPVKKIEREISATRSHLPAQLTPLVGREIELAALEQLLADPYCRLLTLTGMGGVGKTRLALELASRQRALFPAGVYYVSLAGLNTPEFIIPAIADALGFPFSGTLDLQEQLLNHLAHRAGRGLLLVLDNMEHLLAFSERESGKPSVGLLLAKMFQRVPNIKILVTSRERILLQGEWTFELRGLPVPTCNQSEQLEDCSAATLFVQRARQVKANLEIKPSEWPSVTRICQLVEGSPLAIELAAAWVGVLSIDEIADEIASNLDFLTTSMRNVPERHRSLRAAFNHSWKLLSVEEQQGLCRLAVFRGGFQREAANQVAGASLPILMSLFSKSLLLHKGTSRYDLHGVVRQYALAYLSEDPQFEATHEKHCKYYLELVHGREKGIGEASRWVDVQTLEDELDNLREAMTWGLQTCQGECTLQIAIALGQFWFTHGYWREGVKWLEQGLSAPGTISADVRAKALTIAGRLTRYLGDYPRAIAMLQQSLSLWQECDDQTGMAQTLCNLGTAIYRTGDHERATAMLEDALRLAKQQNDLRGLYCSLENLGHAASHRGDSQKAIELYRRSLSFAQIAHDDDQTAKLLNHLGSEYMRLDEFDRAEECFDTATAVCQRLGNRIVGAFVASNRCYISLVHGRSSQAFKLLVEAISVMQEFGSKEETLLCFEPMACIAVDQGSPERAIRLLASSAALRKGIGVLHRPVIRANYDACLASLRSQLDEAVFEAAWAEGSAMTFDQAVDFAVNRSG